MKNIIVMYDNEDVQLNMSLYEYIDEQYRYGNSFIVLNVTQSEYKLMLKQIKKSCLNERLSRINSSDLGYNKFRYLMAFNKNLNNISICDYNDFDKKGNYILDSNGITFVENGIQFPKDNSISRYVGGLRIYTTETYDNVINHYLELKEDYCNIQEIQSRIDELQSEIDKLNQLKHKLQCREDEKCYIKK